MVIAYSNESNTLMKYELFVALDNNIGVPYISKVSRALL